MPRLFLLFVFPTLTLSPLLGQDRSWLPQPVLDYSVRLGEPTVLDDAGVHIEGLMRFPEEIVHLPQIDTTGARFLSLFYTRAPQDDFTITIMVVPTPEGHHFYIDFNNDEDLTNDGFPLFFAQDADEILFTLAAPHDPQQETIRVLGRVPHWLKDRPQAQEWFEGMFDDEANLKPLFVTLNDLEAGGKAGTFYFDDRLDVRKGTVLLEDTTILIGLWDWTANGRYDDEEDLLVVDGHGDGKLTYTVSPIRVQEDGKWIEKDTSYVFKLTDVVSLAGQPYRLTYIDPYGRGLRFAPVTAAATNTFAAEARERWQNVDLAIRAEDTVEPAFWDTTLFTLAGDTLHLAELRGRYVLLNAWGEWCAPCLQELPDLAYARTQWPDSILTLVGLLSTTDLEAAQRVIQDRQISWFNVRLGDAFRQQFDIDRYPTNILVRPDGTYLHVGAINRKFFHTYLP